MPARQRPFHRDTVWGYGLMIPALILIGALVGYPTLYALWLSFHQKLLAVKGTPYVGLSNYAEVLQSKFFWTSLVRTVIYVTAAVAFKLFFGMATALALNEKWPGRIVSRAIVLLPWALPPLTVVLTWRFLLSDTTNVVNYLLMKAHLIDVPIPWLGTATYAFISAVAVNVWRGFPFFTITLLAGLSSIPQHLYDAAEVDGADTIQRFIHVTLPGVFPILIVTLMLSSIWTFNEFTSIWLLTWGGPGDATTTLPIAVYLEAFVKGTQNLSKAVIYTILVFPILFAMIWILNRSIARKEASL